MKKLIILAVFLMITVSQVIADTGYKIAINRPGTRPNFVLIYAKWAPDFELHRSILNSMKSIYSSDADFTEIDISDPSSSAAAEFNKNFVIYTNVPYVVMLKGGNYIYRYIPNECSRDKSCIESKIKTFLKK